MGDRKAVIIGAGPAGLTAATELLEKTGIKPIILEMSGSIGGISRTINYKGNRMDIGGHRFFSKSDRVMDYWRRVMPVQGALSGGDANLAGTAVMTGASQGPDPETEDKVLLARSRLSRIYFLRKFFDYPISLNLNTFRNLGFARVVKIGLSYLRACAFPIKEEKTLEDFFINRFGKELYSTFFENYTEKVWGVPCDRIKPEWGAQRIKGLSVSKALAHAAKNLVAKDSTLAQKKTETSLISRFLYPKYGPGQMWEAVAGRVKEMGGEILLNHEVVGIDYSDGKIRGVTARKAGDSAHICFTGDFYFSSMPVKDLIRSFSGGVCQDAREVAEGLVYRDFITAGLLVKSMKPADGDSANGAGAMLPDNWIYIQEDDVKVGRLQIFNNWSPYMVADRKNVWIGLEYFCDEGDRLWELGDDEFIRMATGELEKLGIVDGKNVIDGTVARVKKTYPAYFGSYDRFHVIRDFVDGIDNLFLIGRNGMHRYNNMDHSMLTAMTAVDNIINGVKSKDNLWSVNAEEEYHEAK